MEGTLFPTQQVVVTRTLPADHPSKKAVLAFVEAYEAKYGRGTVTRSPAMRRASIRVCRMPWRALKAGKPGTKEFRVALHSELEHAHELVVPNGVVERDGSRRAGPARQRDGHHEEWCVYLPEPVTLLPATGFCAIIENPIAQVVKLVDAGDSKSPAARRAGSIPALGTKAF